MTKLQKDNLFQLVKSLSKSEKRQFKLYVGRLGVNTDSKFLNLFNFLEKSSTYNETLILKNSGVKKQQLANVKAHLYKQILISLKLSPSHQNVRSQIREQLDFASILYHKGLYKQSLRILDKAKEFAINNEEKNLAYEVVELEKVIESQYITRSINTRANELTMQAKELSALNFISSKLSNLSLQLYSMILRSGYVKNEEENNQIKEYFYKRLPIFDMKVIGFREKLWLYKAHLWYSFLTQDFLNCYKYASKWVELFHEYPAMINSHPVFFLKANNYLLESLFFIRRKDKFIIALDGFKKIIGSDAFPSDNNIEALQFLYVNLHNLNLYFINGNFEEGLTIIPQIDSRLTLFKTRIDEHHVLTFYYKFACMYFGSGKNDECIFYLDKIISNKSLSMRQDLLCFSRILNLFAHYEAGYDYHIETLLKSTYKFLLKMNDLHEVQKEMIKFIKNLQYIYPQEIRQAFIELHSKLKIYENDVYEGRAFLYLDIISWLESNIENKPIGEIIKNKYSANIDG